jgi:putative transposase
MEIKPLNVNNEKYDWRTGRTCVFKNNVHLVFVTKYRRDVFSLEMIERMRELFLETCEQMDVELTEFGGEDDHVHMLVTVPPKLAIANLVGKLKGKSSYFLRKEYAKELRKKLWGTHLWSPSYCVVSCDDKPLNIINDFVEKIRTPPSQKGIDQAKRTTKTKLD